jgi:multidrug efflux pump subunit AcrB
MLNGIAPQQIVGNLTSLLKEYPISNLYDENSSASSIVLSLEDKDKTNLQDIQNLKIKKEREYDSISDLVKVKQILYKNHL